MPVPHLPDHICLRGELEVMGHDERGHLLLGHELLEQVHDFLLAVQLRQRYPTLRTVSSRREYSGPSLARTRRTCTSTVRAPPK